MFLCRKEQRCTHESLFYVMRVKFSYIKNPPSNLCLLRGFHTYLLPTSGPQPLCAQESQVLLHIFEY